jgi:hypothetical protein
VVYDPLRALRVLDQEGVRYVVIGGVAGRLWGSPTMTNDTDVCCAWDRLNLDRVARALVSLGATLRGVDEDVPLQLDARMLSNGQIFTFATDAGGLDILAAPAGIVGFDELERNAVSFDLGDNMVVRVCALDDLIRMKRAAGRPKDRIELEVLGAVREERNHEPEI